MPRKVKGRFKVCIRCSKYKSLLHFEQRKISELKNFVNLHKAVCKQCKEKEKYYGNER